MIEMLTEQNWLDRAAQARTLAASMHSDDAKQMMEGIAQSYEDMARIAADIEAQRKQLRGG